MKKTLTFIAALCLVLSCASCGRTDEAETPAKNESSVSSSEPVTEDPTEDPTEAPTEEDEDEEEYANSTFDYSYTDPVTELGGGLYQLTDTFTFRLPEGCEYHEGIAGCYEYNGECGISFLLADGLLPCGCTPEAWLAGSEGKGSSDKKYRETGMISGGKNEAGYYIRDCVGEEDEEISCMCALVAVGRDSLSISAYYETENESIVRGLVEQIVESAEYIGGYTPPESRRIIESDDFSLDAEAKWSLGVPRRGNGDEKSLGIVYTCAENLAEYYSGMNFEAFDTEEYPSAESYFEHESDRIEGLTIAEITERDTEAEMLGEKCFKLAYEMDAEPTINVKLYREVYVFEKNGRVIRVRIVTCDAPDRENVLSELRALANSVVIK